LARKAYGNHLTQVNTSTYPDDGSSPVGSNEWNEAPDPAGMLGFTPATANSSTIIVSSGVATITDSVSVIAGEGAATDTLQKLALANTSQYDLVYLFAASSGYVVTLEHGDLNADGEISTISGANEALSTTVPTILMRKGAYWYGYGGGAVTTPTDITVADESSDTTCFPLFVTAATGDLEPKSGSNLAFNSSSGVLTATGFAGALTGAVTGNSDTATALATGRTISATGEVTMTTGSFTGAGNATGAATITDNIVDEANLKVSNGPTNGQFLSAQSGNTGGLTWASAGGGATIVHEFTNTTTTGYLGTASSFGTVGAGDRDIYIKKIDTYNEGVFTKIWKNGSAVEVQIA